jgi:hypothetical protein
VRGAQARVRGTRALAALAAIGTLAAASAAARGTAAGGQPATFPVRLPVSAAVAALPRPQVAAGSPYGWPLRPFNREHAIRGGFGDPRFGAREHNFHFGIDIVAAAYTPVYAVAAGTVYLETDRVDVLNHVHGGRDGGRGDGFSYWHILPAVSEHARAAEHELLGWVNPRWAHLHFSEIQGGRWVNPLRAGALTPFSDPGVPTVQAVMVAPTVDGSQTANGYRGSVAVVAAAYLSPLQQPPFPWNDARFAPAVIRWRVLADGSAVSAWQVAVDFRTSLPPNRMFRQVYAHGTLQNRPGRAGTYLFYLARSWNLDSLPPRTYTIEAQAVNSTGLTAGAFTTFTVASGTRFLRRSLARRP